VVVYDVVLLCANFGPPSSCRIQMRSIWISSGTPPLILDLSLKTLYLVLLLYLPSDFLEIFTGGSLHHIAPLCKIWPVSVRQNLNELTFPTENFVAQKCSKTVANGLIRVEMILCRHGVVFGSKVALRLWFFSTVNFIVTCGGLWRSAPLCKFWAS